MVLNDDCLIEIFRKLSPPELLSIADTCTRFRPIAQKAYALKRQFIDDKCFDSMLHCSKFLRIFGESIPGLKCCIRVYPDQKMRRAMFNLIVDHCSETLKSLSLKNFELTVRRPFSHLKSLELINCTFQNATDADVLFGCGASTYAEMNSEIQPTESISSHLEHLECLTLDHTKFPGGDTQWENILKNQRNLKKLMLYALDMRSPIDSHKIIGVINHFCNGNLKELQIDNITYDDYMVPMLQELFGKLKTLTIGEFIRFGLGRESLFTKCKNTLHTLTVIDVDNFFETTGENDLSELREFNIWFTCNQVYDNYARIPALLKNLTKVRDFTFVVGLGSEIPLICAHIVANVNKWVNVYICSRHCHEYLYEENFLPLSRLEHIKKLTLVSGVLQEKKEYVPDMSKFINGMVSIESVEYLFLCNLLVDDSVIEAISKLKSLRQLKLVNIYKDDSGREEDDRDTKGELLLKPLENLVHLTELTLSGKWIVDNADLINLVTKLTNLKSLTLQLNKSIRYEDIFNIAANKNPRLIISTEYKADGPTYTHMRVQREAYIIV